MADEINSAGGATVVQGTQVTDPKPSGTEFKVPEKFAGKTVEDVAKAYVELEKKLGSNEGWSKLSELGVNGKPASPEEIRQAVIWARQTYGRMTKGELIDAANTKIAQDRAESTPNAQPNQAPWEANDWEYKPAGEQARLMTEYNQRQVKAYVDQIAGQYGQAFEQFRNQQGAEASVMLEAITRAIKTGKDPATIMTLAADLRNKTPQDLMDMAIKNMTAEADLDAEVEKRVSAKLALEQQKRDNESLSLDTEGPSRPARFVPKKRPSDVNRKIVEDLRKKGIRI